MKNFIIIMLYNKYFNDLSDAKTKKEYNSFIKIGVFQVPPNIQKYKIGIIKTQFQQRVGK